MLQMYKRVQPEAAKEEISLKTTVSYTSGLWRKSKKLRNCWMCVHKYHRGIQSEWRRIVYSNVCIGSASKEKSNDQ
jgi:hypothetical protein